MIKYLFTFLVVISNFSAAPITIPGTIGVLYNKTNLTVTPNGLSMVMNTNYSTNLDGGVLASGTSIKRDLSARYAQVVNVLDMGADATGATDSSTAFVNGITLLGSRGGGTLEIPFGKYIATFTNNVSMLHLKWVGSSDVNINTNYGLFPADLTKYVIQVGDDTKLVEGFKIEDVPIIASRGGTNCPGAIWFAGGSDTPVALNCHFIGGSDTVKATTGLLFPSTIHNLISCEAWEGTNSTIYMDGAHGTNANSFCTRFYMIGGKVNGHNSSGYAVQSLNAADLHFVGVQFDMADKHALYSLNGGYALFNNCTVENSTGTGGELASIIYNNQALPVDIDSSRYFKGDFFALGYYRWAGTNSSTTNFIPAQGLWGQFDESVFRKPHLIGPFDLAAVSAPYTPPYGWDLSGAGGDLWLYRPDNVDAIRLVNRASVYREVVDGGHDANRFWELDAGNMTGHTNNNFNVRLFRNTTTVGLAYFSVFKGDGSTTVNHQFGGAIDTYFNADSGKFGIKTTSPSATLDVNGDIFCEGLLYFGGDNIRTIGSLTTNRPSNIFVGNTVNLGQIRTNLLRVDSAGYITNVVIGSNISWDGTTLNASVPTYTNTISLVLGNPGTVITTGTSKNYWNVPRTSTIKSGRVTILVTSSSGSVTMDLKKNGSTILTAPVSITAGSTNAALSFASTALTANDILTGDITAAGTTAQAPQIQLIFTVP